MTAEVFAQFDHEGVEVSGDAFGGLFKETSGTIWDRVADDATEEA